MREDARGAQAGPLAVRLDRDVRIVRRAAQIGGGGVEENDGLGDSVQKMTIVLSLFFEGVRGAEEGKHLVEPVPQASKERKQEMPVLAYAVIVVYDLSIG